MKYVKIFDGKEYCLQTLETLETYPGARMDRCVMRDENGEEWPLSLITYDDGTVFCPKDWQTVQGGRDPELILRDNHWIDLYTGKEAIMYDGFPRLFP